MRFRYKWMRRFLAVFCVALITVLAGIACVIADVNTRSTAFLTDPLWGVTVEFSTDSLPEWTQKAWSLLPAPMRLLSWIPETLGITIPREKDRLEQLPRLPGVAERQEEG